MQSTAALLCGRAKQVREPSQPPPPPPPHKKRIGARFIHVKGAGARGYFETTHDISPWCRAHVFGAVGRRTPALLRCSVAGVTRRQPDTVREVRGFAVRLGTGDGCWDMVGHDTPVFFIKDPEAFPSLLYAQQRDATTQEKDPNDFWEFVSNHPETIHQMCLLYGARGLPDGYRHMNGYGSHTFRLDNHQDGHVFVKFHYKTDQGVRTLSPSRAEELAVSNPDYCIEDMKKALAAGKPTSWTLCIQIMTPAEAAACAWDPFDVTRVWPQGQFRLRPVGRLVLESDPADSGEDVEEIAFSPANMPDGITKSPDRILTARLISYKDTQHHQLGAEAPAPEAGEVHHDGGHDCRDQATVGDRIPPTAEAEPLLDYDPVSPEPEPELEPELEPEPEPAPTSSADDYYSQPCTFFHHVLGEEERQNLVESLALSVCKAHVSIQMRIVNNWTKVSKNFSERLLNALLQYNSLEDAEELQEIVMSQS